MNQKFPEGRAFNKPANSPHGESRTKQKDQTIMARNLSIISAREEGKGKNRILVMDVKLQDPKESHSGKTFVVASETGVSPVKVAGRDVIINLNATVPKDPEKQKAPLVRTTAELKGKIIQLKAKMFENPKASSSGKSMLVVTDSGSTGCVVGKSVVNVTFSAYFYPEDKAA